MAYRLRTDEPIVDGLIRVALEQVDRAYSEATDRDLPRPEAIHQARKRCKNIRGLLRLLRSALADVYRLENVWFRDAAATLASVRALDAMKLALDSLGSEATQPVDEADLDRLREALAAPSPEAPQSQADSDAALARFAGAMQVARHRILRWSEDRIADDETSDAILDGFRKTYRRGRRALRTARQVQADEYLHELRKWVKYHWHHVKLLENLGSKKLKRRAGRLAALNDYLGDDRDLGALRRALLQLAKESEPPPLAQSPIGQLHKGQSHIGHALAGYADAVDHVARAIDQRRGRLRCKAFRLAKRLYVDKPKAFSRRWGEGLW